MPTTTSYSFADTVLVPFPFTDQTTTKKRPAIVVSSDSYNASRPDLILMAVTSQIRGGTTIGEVVITDWKKAGLLKPSVIKPVITTIERGLVLRRLGKLEERDSIALRDALRMIVG